MRVGMQLFEDQIKQFRSFLDEKRCAGIVTELDGGDFTPWPAGRKGGIVMQSETAVELGHPDTESAAFHLWTNEPGLVKNDRIILVGPDLDRTTTGKLPFAKAVLLEVDGFTEESSYERHREIERIRYELHLSGYMMRAVSQAGREWSRVSGKALEEGFSLTSLGSELVRAYRANPHVRAVEVVMITSSPEDVRAVKVLAERSERLIQALNKMAGELSFDCDTCDYTDVCSEVESLRSMRKSLSKEKSNE